VLGVLLGVERLFVECGWQKGALAEVVECKQLVLLLKVDLFSDFV
jgi:hypothetical protein